MKLKIGIGRWVTGSDTAAAVCALSCRQSGTLCYQHGRFRGNYASYVSNTPESRKIIKTRRLSILILSFQLGLESILQTHRSVSDLDYWAEQPHTFHYCRQVYLEINWTWGHKSWIVCSRTRWWFLTLTPAFTYTCLGLLYVPLIKGKSRSHKCQSYECYYPPGFQSGFTVGCTVTRNNRFAFRPPLRGNYQQSRTKHKFIHFLRRKEVIFCVFSLLVCQNSYTKKPLNEFKWNLDGGCVSAQRRPH